MSLIRGSIKHWLMVAAWMLVIFGASSDMGASRNTSRFIGPIVRWLYPDITQAGLEQVVFLIRKGAHVTEYAILAILLWRALSAARNSVATPTPPGSWRVAAMAWAIAATYAASDELHQMFVPSRTGHWQDVALDSCGALLGVLICYGWTRRTCRQAAESPP